MQTGLPGLRCPQVCEQHFIGAQVVVSVEEDAVALAIDPLRAEASPAKDEGLSSKPECEIYCYSWSRQAPAPDILSRQEAGAAFCSHAMPPLYEW